jgi:hypothetical protein
MAKTFSNPVIMVQRAPAAAPPASDRKLAFYRAKGDECQLMAMLAADQKTRDQWLLLAKQWNYLAHRCKLTARAAKLN